LFIGIIFYLRPKLEYASAIWNSNTCQQARTHVAEVAALCYNSFFPHSRFSLLLHCSTSLHTLSERRRHLD